MTSAFTVAIECEGFLPLDPRDPENLDRKHDDRDPKVVEKQRKEWRTHAEKQRKELLSDLRSISKAAGGPKLVDEIVRDDGTAILYFEFDPAPEGDHFTRTVEKRLDQNTDPKKGPLAAARRVATTEPVEESKGEGAKTWDSASRNEVEQARSSVVGAGLQVVECRIEARGDGKSKAAKKADGKKETPVTDPGPSTHQETETRSDEATPEEAAEARREQALREQRESAKQAENDKRKRS